ncbi:MAG: GGDEF domain-containing protein [Phycisphaerae bacterium]|nr:GGDEF domain-containing protein [Phycisphaerae bacterium]
MDNPQLEQILACPRLPSLPAVALEVIELCRQDHVNIQQIAETISNDPALSSKVLKTVNSSFYGLSQPVSTISHALVILGLNSVKSLALGFSLVGSFKDSSGEEFDPTPIWRRSLYSAVAARTFAQHQGLIEHEEAFLAGLLSDLGVMAMIQSIGPTYVQLIEQTGDDHDRLWALELEQLGFDHAQVGEALAEQWKLPPILACPIRYHQQPESSPEKLRPMVNCIALGDKAADVFVQEDATAAMTSYLHTANRLLEMEQQTAFDLLDTIRTGTVEMSKLFDIPTGPPRDPSSILAAANETLLELTLRSQRNASQLQAQNQKLEVRASTDPLTGAANRGHFNQFLRDHFALATEQGRPLSLIFLDMDHFKQINDTHGHQVGDQVLRRLVDLIQPVIPPRALLARYGGEEFTVIIPEMSRQDAARLAEFLRKEIETTPIKLDGGRALGVSASLGVATLENKGAFRKPTQLIKAADQAVYAAKKAGRNCVRVFAPQTRSTKPDSSPPAAVSQ